MNCIFCKNPTDQISKTIEHIIPESLGNVDSILPIGIVCDSCNNYFARKIEKEILGSPIFQLIRFEKSIPNKKGKIPKFLLDQTISMPDYRIMSRFLGKVGLEVLALRCLDVSGWNEEICNNTNLDQIRNYTRFNIGETWPFFYRTIYLVNEIFLEQHTYFEILHEFNLLYTSKKELYIILIIFGVEFALNLGYPCLDGYFSWLKENNYKSPLYIE